VYCNRVQFNHSFQLFQAARKKNPHIPIDRSPYRFRSCFSVEQGIWIPLLRGFFSMSPYLRQHLPTIKTLGRPVSLLSPPFPLPPTVMPPKKKDKTFLSPGTPATRFVRDTKKKKKPAAAVDPPPVPGPGLPAPPPRIGRHRDLGKELIQSFASAGDLATHITLFDVIHLRPISQSFQNQLERLKKFWMSFFTMSEGSEQAAEATLALGAPFPPLPKIKAFVHFIATHGRSGLGIGGITGWTVLTTRKFLGRILTMVCFFSPLWSQLLIAFSSGGNAHSARPETTVANSTMQVLSLFTSDSATDVFYRP
jgi:hypothetical protein